MPELMEHQNPEFVMDLVGRQAESLLALLRGNSHLRAFYGGGIDEFESETLLDVQGRMAIKANFLGVALGPVSLPLVASGNTVQVAAAFDLFSITGVPKQKGTQRWLRSRVMAFICRLIAANGGVLYDVDDPDLPLTDAVISFDRLDFRGRLVDTSLIVTPLRVTLKADMDAVTGEFNL